MTQFDFVVVGAGSGGLAAARRAAKHGARVAIVEARTIGGTCVNVGCVPKKVMFNAASAAEVLREAGAFGFNVDVRSFDWALLRKRRDAYIQRLNEIYAQNLAKEGIHWLEGRARILAPDCVDVEGRRYRGRHLLIATGARPVVPEIPGGRLPITSDGFFALKERPQRVVVVGAGYIGVELSFILRLLGSEVTLVSKYPDVLRHFDSMISREVRQHLTDSGVEIISPVDVLSVLRTENGKLKVSVTGERELAENDSVIWAVGRAPMSEGIGLASVGVQTDPSGFVEVDAFQNTTAAHIYAVGDVTRLGGLTPVAIAAGRRLADRLFGGEAGARLDYENVPSVVFSHPPAGQIGLTEAAARAQFGDDVTVYTTRFTGLYYALMEKKPKTAMKLVCVGPEQRVLGVHAVGLGVDEMLQGFAVAMRLGATKQDFDRTVAIHPTAAEELVTMR